ncbi:MAG: AraC family transcriptional regulator [Clostridiaceae bacterium]|nr:AraC family transcriptional regulator [Clostridiaceae bacterium]
MFNNPINTFDIDAVYDESKEELELKDHFHNSFEIIYILEGKVECWVNNKYYTVSRDSFIFINNMETHKLKVSEYPYKRYYILIKPDFFRTSIQNPVFSSVFSNRSENFRHVLKNDGEMKDRIIKYLEYLYTEIKQKKNYWQDATKSILYLIFVQLYRSYPKYFPINNLSSSDDVIVKIQRYIEENFTGPVSLDEVSKLFYLNKYYISHRFKAITGFTFKEYLIMQRISKAKDLLLYTDEDITWVCMNSGFNNVNHFIRSFKKIENITPLQYRKKYRQHEEHGDGFTASSSPAKRKLKDRHHASFKG